MALWLSVDTEYAMAFSSLSQGLEGILQGGMEKQALRQNLKMATQPIAHLPFALPAR